MNPVTIGEINPGKVAIVLLIPKIMLLNCGAMSKVFAKNPDIEKAPRPIDKEMQITMLILFVK